MSRLKYSQNTSQAQFNAQYLDDSTRWETVGIFFTAVARATFDVKFYPTLYKDAAELLGLREFAADISDSCLDLCLKLDCMNDLQLVLQYENFIVHSYVDGDQSYTSWRRLGDVIASVYALGYHQKIETNRHTPFFLAELRRAAFATIYSADKNVAIFLGRPPRMSKRFCYFQTPMTEPLDQYETAYKWPPGVEISYRAEMRWSALCACLKEEVMELLFKKRSGEILEKASSIRSRATAQWDALPSHFKLSSSLKQTTQSPFSRDFLASVRLNHLHIVFLLNLLSLDRLLEPDDAMVDVSQNMLGLVSEVVLLRDQLANSGTGLVWKCCRT
ncbi:hypothetical protein N8I77_007154 [Diaporthe amygdali]|uniref:Xylanolytic transcriptional activator regulatory domain-containing protein n=1 Tax=Phomopsis amygdali TaxID=1214568 RepID=A0AAD9W1A9_PHOAM|nr:hypothetical protein N8I77_007154 [Diaporthe amygdali]